MPALSRYGATLILGARPRSGLSLSRLSWLCHAVDGACLRTNAPPTSHAGTPATRECPGRIDGPPGARVGAFTHTAPDATAASAGPAECIRPDRPEDGHGLRGRRVGPERGGKQARLTLLRRLHPGGAPTSPQDLAPLPTIGPPSSVVSRATRVSGAGGSATLQTGEPAIT
jgi:hypothetical protein